MVHRCLVIRSAKCPWLSCRIFSPHATSCFRRHRLGRALERFEWSLHLRLSFVLLASLVSEVLVHRLTLVSMRCHPLIGSTLRIRIARIRSLKSQVRRRCFFILGLSEMFITHFTTPPRLRINLYEWQVWLACPCVCWCFNLSHPEPFSKSVLFPEFLLFCLSSNKANSSYVTFYSQLVSLLLTSHYLWGCKVSGEKSFKKGEKEMIHMNLGMQLCDELWRICNRHESHR